MIDHRASHAAAAGQAGDPADSLDFDAVAADPGELQGALRRLGGQAHQLRATTHAADHFIGRGRDDDRNTGSWLVACALELAGELATELDAIDRSMRTAASSTAAPHIRGLRTRAHQLHAAARAADHYLDQDNPADRDTGSWLVACATGLASKLAFDFDDGVSSRRSAAAGGGTAGPADHDSASIRRLAAAAPLRDAPQG